MKEDFLALIHNMTREELLNTIDNLVEKEQIGQAAMEAIVDDRPIPHA